MSANELMENETEQENVSFEIEDEQQQVPVSQEVVVSADEPEEKPVQLYKMKMIQN